MEVCMNEKKSLASKIGYGLGATLAFCVAACVGGAALALTFKLMSMLFGWLF
jgi:hypothetical protein